MSKIKSQLRMAALNEAGNRIEDQLEAAKRSVALLEGAKHAALEAHKKVAQLAEVWDKEATDERLNELASKGGLAVSAEIKRWILRCAGVCQSLSDTAEINGHVARGKAEAFAAAVKSCKVLYDTEVSQVTRMTELENMRAEATESAQEFEGSEQTVAIPSSVVADIMARRAEAKSGKDPR